MSKVNVSWQVGLASWICYGRRFKHLKIKMLLLNKNIILRGILVALKLGELLILNGDSTKRYNGVMILVHRGLKPKNYYLKPEDPT